MGRTRWSTVLLLPPHRAVVVRRYSPSAVGYEQELYTLTGYAPEVRNALEREFMAPVVDEPASRAFKVLLERDNAKLTPDLRHAWTRFLMSLMIRTPHMVEQITREAAQNLRRNLLSNPEEYEAVRKEGSPATFLEWAEKNVQPVFTGMGKSLLPELIENEKIGTAFIRMKWWTVAVARGPLDLLTCDNPFHMTHGLADERCLVVLPLSPRFVFFATKYERRVEEIVARKHDAVVAALNDRMARQAQRYVFGSNDRHLRFVENRMRLPAQK